MTVQEILLIPNKTKEHIAILAEEFKRDFGYDICQSCSGDINYMIWKLKRQNEMRNFILTSDFAQYRMEKGSPEIVTQSTLTDEKAIEYISKNPERIGLFRVYPDNWKELCGLEGKKAEKKKEDCCDEEKEKKPCGDCLRKKLSKKKMSELKAEYKDEVKFEFGMKKAEYIEKIVESQKSK